MILSRVWYVLLGLAVAVAMYVVYIAVGQYERQGTRALKEGLASDSQTVEWALKIDARRRLDALLAGSVDSSLQQALVEANGPKDGKVPDTAKQKAKKALATVNDAIPADWRDDALFAVDRDGQVVAALGYDQVAGNDDFELGGYAAVNDALHGWLRDDVWLLGSKVYVVVARPVEYDATQRPAGAIVGLKEINQRFAADLAKRTRTALAFFAGGARVAGGVGVEGFDEEKLDAVGPRCGCSRTTWARCTRACRATCGRRAAASLWRGARYRWPGRWGSSATRTTRTRRTCPGRCSQASSCWRRSSAWQ
jgi:CHASE4 domain